MFFRKLAYVIFHTRAQLAVSQKKSSSPVVILRMEKTMVAKVISEVKHVKSISVLEIYAETGLWQDISFTYLSVHVHISWCFYLWYYRTSFNQYFSAGGHISLLVHLCGSCKMVPLIDGFKIEREFANGGV